MAGHALTATFSNPAYNYSGGGSGASTTVPITLFSLSAEFEQLPTLMLYVNAEDITTYSSETDDTNPLQLNSTVTFTDTLPDPDITWFKGVVKRKPIIKSHGEGFYIEVYCESKMSALIDSFVKGPSGEQIWSLATDAHEVTQMTLQESSDYGSFQGDTLWPDPDTADGAKAYIKDASAYNDSLDTQILNTDVPPFDIILSTTDKKFQPRGWVKIGTEFFYYDGYDDAEADGKYRCRCKARGCLKTTIATHAATSTVYEKLPKQIAPAKIIFEQLETGGSAFEKKRRGKEFEVANHLGCFVLPEAADGTYRCTYSIYDEDQSYNVASTVISLNTIVQAILTRSVDYGGCGFQAGDCNFDCGDLVVNRYDYDPKEKPKKAYDAIMDLIAEVGLQDQVKFFYKDEDDQFRLVKTANGAASFEVPFVHRVDQEVSLDDVCSFLRVPYQDDQKFNRANVTRAWHQAATGVGTSPDYYRATFDNGETYDWGDFNFPDYTAAGAEGLGMVTDGKSYTKCTAVYKHDPGDSIDFGHFWFNSGDDPDPIYLDEIILRIGSYRGIDATQPHQNSSREYYCKLQGCDDYNVTAHSGTWEDIGCALSGRPNVYGKWVEGKFDAFLKRKVSAIRIIWDYMPGAKTVPMHWAPVHDLIIYGNERKYVEVQLTDNAANKGNPYYIYAPATFEKLRGGINASGSAGTQLCKEIDIGPSSDGAALSMARKLLKLSLVKFQQRTYEYNGLFPSKPHLNLTVDVDEDGDGVADYTGVITGYSLSVTPDGILTTATVRDYDSSVIE